MITRVIYATIFIFHQVKIQQGTELPVDFDKLIIPSGKYQKITAKGEMRAYIANV
jgi:predicted transcriptional regulator YdeE